MPSHPCLIEGQRLAKPVVKELTTGEPTTLRKKDPGWGSLKKLDGRILLFSFSGLFKIEYWIGVQ